MERAGNRTLGTVSRLLHGLVAAYYRRSAAKSNQPAMRRAVRSYRKLVGLIEAGDAAPAEEHRRQQMAYTVHGTTAPSRSTPSGTEHLCGSCLSTSNIGVGFIATRGGGIGTGGIHHDRRRNAFNRPVTDPIETFRVSVQAVLAGAYERRDPDADDDRTDILPRAPDGHAALAIRARQLQRLLVDAGLVGLTLPVEYGGRGLTRRHEAVLEEELRRFDTPSRRPLGIGPTLALPTILRSGSESQKRRFLAPIVRGEELWCQLFSEPDAGSDLASLRTRAVNDEEGWLIDGQKVWSSYAADATFGLLLARTDPSARKPQAGMTMFILPMDAPGVSVHPLVDIAGGQHFNEVFLSGVRLLDDAVLGEVNGGWTVATGTLGGERAGYLGGSGGGRRRRQIVEAAEHSGGRRDAAMRQRTVSVIAAEWLLERLRDRLVAGFVAGGNAAAGSLMKLAAGNLEQEVAVLLCDLTGLAGAAWSVDDRDGDVAAHGLATSRQASIAGGTHQIQRNLVGERILGLPRS